MAPDYNDWITIAHTTPEGRERNERELLTRVATGDRASALLNDPNWAWCIKEFEEARDSAQARADALKVKILSPDVVSLDEFNRLKNQLVEAETYARAWQQAIDTPSKAIDRGEAAEKTLKRAVGVANGI